MSAATTLWATLGISATDDRAAIRRAYASRLRVVHPEDDPEGFKQLRVAYEQAMMLAERALALAAQAAAKAAAQPVPREPELAPEPALEAVAEAPPSDAETPIATPAQRAHQPAAASPPLVGRPAHHAAHEAACNRLAALLTGTADPSPAELDAALTAVLSSPALDDVSIHLQTEAWLARLICHAVPRSDAIAERAAAAFGWRPDALYVADPAVAGAITRLSALATNRLLARLDGLLRGPVEPEENKLYGALDALTAPSVARHPQHGSQVEVALARMLLATRPRSDALMAVVTRRLGWDAPARQATADAAVLDVARIAGQIQPRRQVVVRPRSRSGAALARLRVVWIVLLVMGGLSYCASQISKIASYEQAQADAPPASTAAPQVLFTQVPTPKIDVGIASTSSGVADLSCVAGDGRLRDCSVVSATNSDKADQGRYCALAITWPPYNTVAPQVGERVPVHVTFRGV